MPVLGGVVGNGHSLKPPVANTSTVLFPANVSSFDFYDRPLKTPSKDGCFRMSQALADSELASATLGNVPGFPPCKTGLITCFAGFSEEDEFTDVTVPGLEH